MTRSSYPIVLTDLAGARCVVVGSGAVAERKVAGLLEAGARPTVISPTLTATLAAWHEAGRIAHVARPYAEGDLDGVSLAFAATDDPAVNGRVAADARLLGALVNVADDPAAGSFHTVGAVRRGDLLLTVSTGGQSPAFAAYLRAELAERYGPEYAGVLAAAAGARRLPAAARAALVALLCAEPALGWLREGRDELVAAAVQQAAEVSVAAAQQSVEANAAEVKA